MPIRNESPFGERSSAHSDGPDPLALRVGEGAAHLVRAATLGWSSTLVLLRQAELRMDAEDVREIRAGRRVLEDTLADFEQRLGGSG